MTITKENKTVVKLMAIRSKDEMVIAFDGYNNRSIPNFIFNDELKAEKTFSNSWFKIPTSEIKSIHAPGKKVIDSQKWILRDESLESAKIPLTIRYDKVEMDEDGDWSAPEYMMYQSLYKLDVTYKELSPEEIDFEIRYICDDLKELPNVSNFKYPTGTRWDRYAGKHHPTNITYKDIVTGPQAAIFYPEILHPLLPCELTPEQSFKIIHNFLEENIDRSVASFTSYENIQILHVKKIIGLHTPYSHKVDVSSFRSRRPKYEDRMVKTRDKEIYTIDAKKGANIPVFSGDSLEDLDRNISTYLNALIEYINTPVVDCPTCDGFGIVHKEFKDPREE